MFRKLLARVIITCRIQICIQAFKTRDFCMFFEQIFYEHIISFIWLTPQKIYKLHFYCKIINPDMPIYDFHYIETQFCVYFYGNVDASTK